VEADPTAGASLRRSSRTIPAVRGVPLGPRAVLFAAVCVAIALAHAGRAAARGQEKRGGAISFNRDIRPILAENCFACHGPDESRRKTRFHFDTREGAFAKNGVIVPGSAATSLVIQRVTAADPAVRMPPRDSGYTLTTAQIDLVRRWIDEGATWDSHWAFVPPVRPELPAVDHTEWVRNPIDRFILARLEREGLKPSPTADKVTLLRRLTYDLTGLPPTPAEVDAFAADRSPDAYE
jgi:mono/diheme cytochrome c family protein